MVPVNVIVSGLPQGGSLCLQLGCVRSGVTARQVDTAIRKATGLPYGALLLRTHARVLRPCDPVVAQGDGTAFVRALIRRALPGGRNSFTGNTESSPLAINVSKETRNIDVYETHFASQSTPIVQRHFAASHECTTGVSAGSLPQSHMCRKRTRETSSSFSSSSFTSSATPSWPATCTTSNAAAPFYVPGFRDRGATFNTVTENGHVGSSVPDRKRMRVSHCASFETPAATHFYGSSRALCRDESFGSMSDVV